jgi:hypothetical protein
VSGISHFAGIFKNVDYWEMMVYCQVKGLFILLNNLKNKSHRVQIYHRKLYLIRDGGVHLNVVI